MNTPARIAPHRAFEVVRIPSTSSLRNGGTGSVAGSVMVVVVMPVALATDGPVASIVPRRYTRRASSTVGIARSADRSQVIDARLDHCLDRGGDIGQEVLPGRRLDRVDRDPEAVPVRGPADLGVLVGHH